jgi:ABC-type Mn2+/Zn2+ transport system permease subunit
MEEFLIYSLVTGIFVGFAAGFLGSIMVLEKMALVGDALSHVALPGLALGVVFNFDPFIGAFAFLFVAAIVIWHIGRVTKLSFEAIVGAMFTLCLAIGILLIPEVDLLEALFGDITKVSMFATFVAIVTSLLAIGLTQVIYKRIVLGMISEDLALSSGVNLGRINLLYLLLVSLVVAIGIRIVGTLLVGFIVVVPAATAKILSSNLLRYSLLSGLFGTLSACSGILLASYLGLLPGPLVVFSGTAIFLTIIVAKWLRGPRGTS